MRLDGRAFEAMRSVEFDLSYLPHAEGACLVKFGNTHVLCAASVEDRVPPFLKGSRKGWVTAEYGMLPRSTHTRSDREAARGKQSGRTYEIQRLIGRSLRAVVNTDRLGERQIKIDCDVLRADGGTRTAAITGGYIALFQACLWLLREKKIRQFPLTDQVAALSCGLVSGKPLVDLNYGEDSVADTDMNVVLAARRGFIEIQASAEGTPFRDRQFQSMLSMATDALQKLLKMQKEVLMKVQGAADAFQAMQPPKTKPAAGGKPADKASEKSSGKPLGKPDGHKNES